MPQHLSRHTHALRRCKPSRKTPPRRSMRCLLLPCGVLVSLLTGCGIFTPPQAWEKGNLARPEMTMDKDPLEAKFTSHVYFSKEAASGGDGVGGGGCGCN